LARCISVPVAARGRPTRPGRLRPPRARTLYFGADGSLGWQAPAAGAAPYDEYVSDPNKPLPYLDRAATGVPKDYMVADQRFAASRPDVLVYRSAVLEEDVTLVGPVKPALFVSTAGGDADFIVKLIDVYPPQYPRAEAKDAKDEAETPSLAGYQQLVRGDPLRGKFRNDYERGEAFTPGKVESLSYSMADINHTFRRGHRIMVQVQSSWFPLLDLNPQTFVDIPHAKAEDFQKATQRVFHAPAMYFGVVVGVLPAAR